MKILWPEEDYRVPIIEETFFENYKPFYLSSQHTCEFEDRGFAIHSTESGSKRHPQSSDSLAPREKLWENNSDRLVVDIDTKVPPRDSPILCWTNARVFTLRRFARRVEFQNASIVFPAKSAR